MSSGPTSSLGSRRPACSDRLSLFNLSNPSIKGAPIANLIFNELVLYGDPDDWQPVIEHLKTLGPDCATKMLPGGEGLEVSLATKWEPLDEGELDSIREIFPSVSEIEHMWSDPDDQDEEDWD